MAASSTKAEADLSKDDRTIVQRILAVANEVGVVEPTKSGGVPFKFRGVDAVVAALTPVLNKHGVFVVPVGATQLLDQQPSAGKTLTKADLTVQYRFYGYKGDFIDAEVPGQADDYADRSTAQAMSVAFRILLLQTFHIAAFGNEEEASEETKSAREKAGDSKVANARTKAAGPSADTPTPAEQMRGAILAAAAQKGWDPDKINQFAGDVTGKTTEQWWDNPDELNKILVKINDAK